MKPFILYDDQAVIRFEDYGIEIPSLSTRKSNVLQSLFDDPELGPLQEKWFKKGLSVFLGRDDLLLAHTQKYVDLLLSENPEKAVLDAYELIDKEGNFNRYDPENAVKPLSAMVENAIKMASGTTEVCRMAWENKSFSYYLGGGMHHAHPGFGHGFCPVSDIAVGIRKAQKELGVKNVWIIDVDAHKGDGTGDIFYHDETVKTFSIHMADGWPLDTPLRDEEGRINPWHLRSDFDIAIGKNENREYNTRLEKGLSNMEKHFPDPDMVVVVLGVDPHEADGLQSTQTLKLTDAEMETRDNMIYSFFEKRKIPAAYVMAGGYGDQAWKQHSRFLKMVLRDKFNLN